MKLARIADNEPFYSVVVERPEGEELFDFAIVVPNTLRPDMPISHLEYLPVLMEMQQRDGVLPRIQARLDSAPDDEYLSFRRPLSGASLIAPIAPTSLRCFETFEAHAWNRFLHEKRDSSSESFQQHFEERLEEGLKERFKEWKRTWSEEPGFYFGGTSEILGPYAPIPSPDRLGTRELDYELTVAALIGKPGRDIPVAEADSYIAGFTICNTWKLRDIERRERRNGHAPGKSGDFATSIGPYIVTPDSLLKWVAEDPASTRGRRYSLRMSASVNGHLYSEGNLGDMCWTFAELIAVASRNTRLRPGDLISSGCIGNGCIQDRSINTITNAMTNTITNTMNGLRYLQPDDVVRLDVDGLGSLENRIAW